MTYLPTAPNGVSSTIPMILFFKRSRVGASLVSQYANPPAAARASAARMIVPMPDFEDARGLGISLMSFCPVMRPPCAGAARRRIRLRRAARAYYEIPHIISPRRSEDFYAPFPPNAPLNFRSANGNNMRGGENRRPTFENIFGMKRTARRS